MAESRPPYDATVENIRKLCRELRDVSDVNHDDLEEQVDDLSGSTFNRNLEAAVILGLFKEEDGRYTPTTKGKRIGYGLSDEEEQELFREIVAENEFYAELLEISGEELTQDGEEQYLARDDVQSDIGIHFDFGVGDRTLESAAGVFLKVLDAANLGEYKQGRSGYPTRLVVNDEYSAFLAEVVGKSREEEQEPTDTEQAELSSQVKSSSQEQYDSVEKEDENNTTKEGGDNSEQIHEEELVVKYGENSSMDVQIHIEISSADWGSEEVIDFIEAVQSE